MTTPPLPASPRLWRLFCWEVKLFGTQRSTWLLLSLLFLAMTWGMATGQQQVLEQQAAIDRIHQREAGALAQQKAAASRYAHPAEARLAYWLDPTEISGYMRYHLVAFAVKPPSPLGALATGQGKLLPFYLRAELDPLTPPDTAFDVVNPRVLSLGDFDLAFVLTCLLPLALIVLGGSRLSAERDAGILRLLATQGASGRQLVALRFGAITAVCLPAILLSLGLAWLICGGRAADGQAWRILGIVAAAVAGYSLFWTGLIALVASRTGVIASHTLLVALWAGLTFLVPAGSAFVLDQLHPGPSRLQYLDELRQQSNLTPSQRDAITRTYLEARPDYSAALGRLAQLTYATKQIAVQDALERRLQPQAQAAARAREGASALGDRLRWLSPATLLDATLQTAAGTDAARHGDFLRRSQAYIDELRTFFWPRALREAASPTDGCAGCAGRFNFTEHDRIPRFSSDAPLEGVAGPIGAWTAGLWLLAVLTTGLSLGSRRLQP